VIQKIEVTTQECYVAMCRNDFEISAIVEKNGQISKFWVGCLANAGVKR
jgi:hypothetical protein